MLRSKSFFAGLISGAFLIFCGIQNEAWLHKVSFTEEGRYKPSNVGEEKIVSLETSSMEKLSQCSYPPLKEAEQFLNYGKKTTYCNNLVPFGGPVNATAGVYYDGQKMVCQDESYKMNPENCIVLSFGIADDWTFDDDMDKYGCKVFSFDPTIGLQNHRRLKNIQFYNLGLGNSKRTEPFKKDIIEVDTYEGILQKLNLTYRVIDYLKIDIEGTEVDFFADVFSRSPQLLDNVKQIGMELHPDAVRDDGPPNGRMYSYWEALYKMECIGFKLLSWQLNMKPPNPYKWRNRQESACYEVVWGRRRSNL